MSFAGKSIAITESSGPLPEVFAAAFARDGASVEWLRAGTPPAEFTAAHPDTAALIYFPAPLPSGPTLELLSDPAPVSQLNAELARFLTTVAAFTGPMQRQGKGCILVVGNLTATTGWPGYALPGALNGALLALTRSLACEFATSNVRLLYLSRGAVQGETPDFAARAPDGRAGTPDEIARVAVHLASDRASFMTGTEVRADGGWKSWGLLR